MKCRLLALFAILCLSLTAHADLASRRAKSQEMLLLLPLDCLMDQLMSGTMDQMSAMTKNLGGSNIKPEDQARLDDFQKRVYQLISSQVGWKALEPDYVDLYANNFTDEQLDAILAFYKSPTGVALIDKLPTLTSEGMQIAQAKMTALQPQLKQMLDDFAKTVAAHAASPTQTGSPK
jgi:uncharacterized protein